MLVQLCVVVLQEGYNFGYVELGLKLLLLNRQFLDLLLELLLFLALVL